MARPNYDDSRVISVTVYYKKGDDNLFFLSNERASAAVEKIKDDVDKAGSAFVSADDEYGNTIHFRGNDFVRANISAPAPKK